jgi:hypothetical protein
VAVGLILYREPREVGIQGEFNMAKASTKTKGKTKAAKQRPTRCYQRVHLYEDIVTLGDVGTSENIRCEVVLSRPKRGGFTLYGKTTYFGDWRFSQTNIRTPEAFVEAYNACLDACDEFWCGDLESDIYYIEQLDEDFAAKVRAYLVAQE